MQGKGQNAVWSKLNNNVNVETQKINTTARPFKGNETETCPQKLE